MTDVENTGNGLGFEDLQQDVERLTAELRETGKINVDSMIALGTIHAQTDLGLSDHEDYESEEEFIVAAMTAYLEKSLRGG